MKTCAVVFTYPGDYPKAIRLTQNLKNHLDTIFFCIESRDKNVPLPEWVTPLVVDFDRCRQLHGTQAIIGMKSVYTMLVEQMHYDAILKIDSDTIILRPEQFITPMELGSDYAYIRRLMSTDKKGRFVRRCNGCAYMMSANAVREMNKIPPERFDEILYVNDRHEDLVFSNFFTELPSVNIHDIDKRKVWWSVMPYRKQDCICCHFGYVDIERIREELTDINPLIVDEVFSEANEEYLNKFYAYCNDNNIKLKEYKNMYTRDGKPIEKTQEQQESKIEQSEQAKNDSLMNNEEARNAVIGLPDMTPMTPDQTPPLEDNIDNAIQLPEFSGKKKKPKGVSIN